MKNRVIAGALVLFLLLFSLLLVVLPTFFSNSARITQMEKLELPLILDANDSIELVFFGYSGCETICTPRLHFLATWYKSLPKELQNSFNVRFMDISIPENRSLPMLFAQSFHPKFHGVFLEQSALRSYTKAFSVYFSKTLLDQNEMDHTTHLYLVKRAPEGKFLRYIYTAYPYDTKQITKDIEELINE